MWMDGLSAGAPGGAHCSQHHDRTRKDSNHRQLRGCKMTMSGGPFCDGTHKSL
jgi:CDGSH-type Zn-finger protein